MRDFGSAVVPDERTRLKAVRHYSIKLINGVTTFTCPRCKHSVTTPDFSIQNGSLRTQAARAMNEHAAAVHNNPLPMYPRDAQMWRAR